jgi:hypothetical protein
MKRSSGLRKTAKLSESVHQQLNMYALAAGAAGVSVLALAARAEAKIVYTPAHVQLSSKPFPLDLNHDGIVDFYLLHHYVHSSTFRNNLEACQFLRTDSRGESCIGSNPGANEIRVIEGMSTLYGAALRAGAKIQRGDRFRKGHAVNMGGMQYPYLPPPRWYGPWINGGRGVKNRYLGIRVQIKGQVHYGWARMTVTTTQRSFTATLTGYAYETIPGKAIIAGATQGSDDTDNSIEPDPAALTVPTPEPATLGALAMGAPGLSIWRRKQMSLDGQ